MAYLLSPVLVLVLVPTRRMLLVLVPVLPTLVVPTRRMLPLVLVLVVRP